MLNVLKMAAASIAFGLIANDLYVRAPSLAIWIIDVATKKLPAEKRDKFRLGCCRELDTVQGNLSKIFHALGCLMFSISPKLNLLRVSRWRSLRKIDSWVRNAVDTLFKCLALVLAYGAVGCASIVYLQLWQPLAFSLFPLLLIWLQWHEWNDILIPLVTGQVALIDLPDCSGVSADLIKDAENDDIDAQSEIGEIYRRVAITKCGLDRLIHFHAAETWLRRAAKGGSRFAQTTLITHLHKCREHEEAQTWERMLAECAHPN
jgi:hypothetical protein